MQYFVHSIDVNKPLSVFPNFIAPRETLPPLSGHTLVYRKSLFSL